jgi:5'-nucleotidase
VSIVPCQFDLTAAHGLAHLSQQWALPLPAPVAAAVPPQPIAPEDYGVANQN